MGLRSGSGHGAFGGVGQGQAGTAWGQGTCGSECAVCVVCWGEMGDRLLRGEGVWCVRRGHSARPGVGVGSGWRSEGWEQRDTLGERFGGG